MKVSIGLKGLKKMYDIQKIMGFLPHRYPFILVDRVVELESGQRIVALKNVTINEPFFQGHFPGAPIMPGVLIVEAMARREGCCILNQSMRKSMVPWYISWEWTRLSLDNPLCPAIN